MNRLNMMLMNAMILFDKNGTKVPEVNVDVNEATKIVKDIVEPLTNIGLIIVPIVGILACIVTGVIWFTKDEEEREQKPLGRAIKKLVMWTIIIECIPAIAKIFFGAA